MQRPACTYGTGGAHRGHAVRAVAGAGERPAAYRIPSRNDIKAEPPGSVVKSGARLLESIAGRANDQPVDSQPFLPRGPGPA